MIYPQFSKSIYTRITVVLILVSFVLNRIVYGSNNPDGFIWRYVNCGVAILLLIVLGVMGLIKGYKSYGILCLSAGLVGILLAVLFFVILPKV